MNELLNEEFTIQFDKAMLGEFERFIADVGENILDKTRASGKAKPKGTLFVGHTPIEKKDTLLWHIDSKYVPMIWETMTNDYGLAPMEDSGVRFEFSLAENENGEKQAWFALCDKYNKAPTSTFTRFVFGLNDYLKPHGFSVICKPCKYKHFFIPVRLF